MKKGKVLFVLVMAIVMGSLLITCGSVLDPFGGEDYVCVELGSSGDCASTMTCTDMNESGHESDYYVADGVKFYERDYGGDQWAAWDAMQAYCNP